MHTHTVLKTRPPDLVHSATLDQILTQVDARYSTFHSMTSAVELVACTGGGLEGEVKCLKFSGFIILGAPERIEVILKVPVLSSTALVMVSDGKTFKMKIPPKSCAIIGSDIVTNTAQKGLYSLRPAVILDSMLIRGLEPGQVVAMTQDSRDVPDPRRRKGIIQEPDYDIEFLSQPQGDVARALRVLHTSRVDLLPYRQDIYNAEGKVATQAFYSNYQRFGDVNFPTKIEIERPLDELSLTITLGKKTVFNQPLLSNQFDLGPIPAEYATYNMDDPAVAATVPCAARAPQSLH